MKFAIISAGEGSRLTQEGITVPKPLVELNGKPMIERLIRLFVRVGATEIAVIINKEQSETFECLEKLQTEFPLKIKVETTPSSMHSFYALAPFLTDDRFCLTTVDTIFREDEFTRFIDEFNRTEADGMMAVTDYVDDEKPLYVSMDSNMRITGFHDKKPDDCCYVSGGIYCLKSSSLKVLQRCMDEGVSRMRNFQRELVAEGMNLRAWPFNKIIDVDHVSDIAKAEAFLNESDS